MNREIANLRLKDVLNVDSINSTQADFLSTHVPFRNISVTNDLTGKQITEYVSEEEIFSKFFSNSNIYNRHQLIVVDGSSGSGKSHFIRWISAKLHAQEECKDVVLMIRRSDNTLKGTIKQFLDLEEVQNIKNKDVYERLVRANQNVSEQRFKYEIYHKFLVEISDDEEGILSSNNKKNFRELLSSSEFEERMLMAGGPIERIYSKIVDTNVENNEDVLALFDVDDFTMDYEFNLRLKNNASKKAVKMANKLLPEADGSFEDEECNPKILTDYMNSKVEEVIRSCAGIEPGDFQQIFKEIRQELYYQGKNLVLLIEDITSCTGINQDLLNALIVEHTGANEIDCMCRLISVIGTTTEYFREFRDNYIDRISTKITIEDGAIGNNTDDLIQFVAKYLNVISINSEEIDAWYLNGALESDYPVHVESVMNMWDSYNYNGRRISLYPFTRRAIINLYNGLEQNKTPRYIIRKIIEPAVDNILQNKKQFPNFLKAKSANLNFNVEAKIKSILVNMQLPDEEKEAYRDRVFAIIGFWGDGTLIIKDNDIGKVGANVFLEFDLQEFAEKILGRPIGHMEFTATSIEKEVFIDPISIEPPKVEILETNKKFEDFARILSDWRYEGKRFTKAYEVRDEVCNYIFATIPWQREGVSLTLVQQVEESSYKIIVIENQDRGIDKGLFILPNSDETYQMLLAFGKWLYLGKKSWNFGESVNCIRIITTWIERNKRTFVDIVRGYTNKDRVPLYIKCAIIAEVYRGFINGDYSVNRIVDLEQSVLVRNKNQLTKKENTGHSREWIELQENILYASEKQNQNIELIQKYFNIIQGISANVSRRIMNYTDMESVFRMLRKQSFEINIEDLETDKYATRNTSIDYLKKILKRIDNVVEAEITDAKYCYKSVLKYLGYNEDVEIELADIKELIYEIADFYGEIDRAGINIGIKSEEIKFYKENCNNLVKALAILNTDLSDKLGLEVLIIYSKNPMKIVKQFIKFLDSIEEDRGRVYSNMINEKEKLTRSGNWSDNVDPRFDEVKKKFDRLMDLMEG